jgi:hypothetical protein
VWIASLLLLLVSGWLEVVLQTYHTYGVSQDRGLDGLCSNY